MTFIAAFTMNVVLGKGIYQIWESHLLVRTVTY
jgi:hypothetical protein